jgi:hypothetical protein
MIGAWLARMNQRERVLAFTVAGILFLLINLAIWNALLGMSAGARAAYAEQRSARQEQQAYLADESKWRQRAEWLEKNQPALKNPAEASSLLTLVKDIAGRYNVQVENPQIGATADDARASIGLGHLRNQEQLGTARPFPLRRAEAGELHRF